MKQKHRDECAKKTVSANDNDNDSDSAEKWRWWRFGAHPFFWWWMNLAYSQYGFGEFDTTLDSDNNI